MLAAQLVGYGDPSLLVAAEVTNPTSREGWLTVDLRASALNWHDVLVRQGMYRSPLPHVMGADGAGICRETGEEVVILPSLWWGDREAAPETGWQILGDHVWGTYAEAVQVPADCVAPKPRGLSWQESAALPLVGLTCYRALINRGRLTAGEHVLILGASGGVASVSVAMVNAAGAHAYVTSSSQTKIDQAVERGARGGVSYTDPDWVNQARSMTPEGRGFDLVLDSVGTWSDSIAALRPGGRLVVLGASQSVMAEVAIRPFYFGQFEVIGTTMGSPRDFHGFLQFMEQTNMAPPVISAEFPLTHAGDAHRYLESGEGFGKVILRPES